MSGYDGGKALDIESMFAQVDVLASAVLGTIPFFSKIRKPLQRHLGIDIGKYLIGLYVSVGIFLSLKRIWKGFWPWLARFLTSSVSIQTGTPAYEDVLNWVTENVTDRQSRWADGARSLVISTGRYHGEGAEALGTTKSQTINEERSCKL